MEATTAQPENQSAPSEPAKANAPAVVAQSAAAVKSVAVKSAAAGTAKPNPNKWLIRFRKLHGWFGVVLALFLVLMGLTGFLLNHKNWLEALPRFSGWTGSNQSQKTAAPAPTPAPTASPSSDAESASGENSAPSGESASTAAGKADFLGMLQAVVEKLGETKLVWLERREESGQALYRVKATDGREWHIDTQGQWHQRKPAKQKHDLPFEPTTLGYVAVVQTTIAQVGGNAAVQKVERRREHEATVYRVRLSGQREATVTPDGTVSVRQPKIVDAHAKAEKRDKHEHGGDSAKADKRDKHDKHDKREHDDHAKGEKGDKPKGGINWPKLIKDIHTGKILGISGKLLADLTALSLVFFSLSGIYLWGVPLLRKRRSERQRQQQQQTSARGEQ